MTSEADTRANYIDPALASSGWQSSRIVREYYFTDGRKLAGGQRGARCFVDYLLRSSNRHLAIIEAKKQSAHPTQGLDFLHFVLNSYEGTGVSELARDRMPGLIKMSELGTTRDASRAFGGSPAQVLTAFRQLQQELYSHHARA